MAFTPGDDPPTDPDTAGYTLNHFCLLTHSLAPMLSFYRDALGMRTLFTYAATDDFRIAYLGYPRGGAHQSGAEMLATKGSREGLLELVEVRWQAAAASPGGASGGGFEASTARMGTFSHVGVNVPDVRRAEERVRAHGAKVLKGAGEAFEIPAEGGPLANAFGLAGDLRKAREGLAAAAGLGLADVLFVEDPDGNLVEIQQIG